MKILFRADLSSSIGSGHVRRCLALASALRGRGAEVAFACAADHMPPPSLIKGKVDRLAPVESEILTRDFARGWEARPAKAELQRRDAAATHEAIGDFVPDLVVTDHYLLDREWESHWPEIPILAVDDLANREHACDFLLDQTFGREAADYANLVPQGCAMMLGSQYALLRPDFAKMRSRALEKRARADSIGTVLVNFGDSDGGGLSQPVAEYLLSLNAEFSIVVVCGSGAPALPALQDLARNPRVRLEIDLNDMATAMLQADLAIGAGGTTAWERCTLALPTIVIPVAANQALLSANLAQAEAAIVCAGVDDIGPALAKLQENFERWHDLVAASAALCDGHGADRVAAKLARDGPEVMHLRPAVADDSFAIWAWRNDPLTRRMAEAEGVVRLADHQRWFAAALRKQERRLLVAEIAGEPVGMVRFDLAGGEATVSINVAPAWRGNSLGGKLLKEGIERYAKEGRAERLVARVRLDNQASQAIFLRSGFRQVASGEGFITFGIDLPADEMENG